MYLLWLSALIFLFICASCSNLAHALKQAVKLKGYRYSAYLKNLIQHWDADDEKLSPTSRQQLLAVKWVFGQSEIFITHVLFIT